MRLTESRLRQIIHESIRHAIMEDIDSNNLESFITPYIQEANEYVSDFGLSVVFNPNYNFDSPITKNWLAVYQNRSVANGGKIRIGINLSLIKREMKENGIDENMLSSQLNISVFHEAGHGIMEFLKRLRRRDTQNRTNIFSKEMKKDFKNMIDNEEEVVEEFGALQEGYATSSELDDFLDRYRDEILKMRDLKSIQRHYNDV